MKIAIKNPAPFGEYQTKWGDFHFGEALQRALEQAGVEVEQHFWPDWDVDVAEDVVLVLRGKRQWSPPENRRGRQYVMWVLSHPADLNAAECDGYDRIFSASETHQHLLSAVTKTPVGLMRQCTDTSRFFPPERSPEADAQHRAETVFVGNSRNVRREIVQWAVDIGRPPVIIGREWERFGFKPLVRQKWIENRALPSLYRNARLSLNDHWHDMRAFGMINNRIFDALACGLPVISDYFPELEAVLGESVLYARDADALRAAMKLADADYPALLHRTAEGWRALKDEFTFTRRAEQLLAELAKPAKKVRRRATIGVPREWLVALERSLREQSALHELLRGEQEQRAAGLSEEISERKAKWSELKRRLDQARDEIDVLKSSVKEQSTERSRAEKLAKQLEAAAELEKRRVVVAEEGQSRLQAQLDHAKEEISERKAKWSELKRRLDQAREEIDVLKSTVKEQSTERSRAEKLAKQLEAAAELEKRRVVVAEEGQSRLQAQLDRAKEEISERKTLNSRLKEQLRKEQAASEQQLVEIASLRAELETSIAERKRKWSELKSRLDQSRADTELLKSSLKTARNDVRQWQSNSLLLQRELEKLIASRSWKASSPIRWIGAFARGRRPGKSSAEVVLEEAARFSDAPEFEVPKKAPAKPVSDRSGNAGLVAGSRSSAELSPPGAQNRESGALASGDQPDQEVRAAPATRGAKRAGGGKLPYSIRKLESKLWGGYVDGSLAELQQLLDTGSRDKLERVWAAWALARWYHCHGNFEQSLRLSRKMAELDQRRLPDKRRVLLEAEALMALERWHEAAQVLEAALKVSPGQPDLILALVAALAGAVGDESTELRRLTLINGLYEFAGLAPLVKPDRTRPLALDNLGATANPLPAEVTKSKVTIIMPVFNAQATIEMAVTSLLSQTWTNLEILAVDDCSEDDTVAVLKRLAARDDRVRVHCQSVNAGAYAARNAGLAVATGDFITTHDSDDWSHPQKIERQVLALQNDPLAQASVSFWCRAHPNLAFHGTERPSGQYLQWNHSSLLVRRDAMQRLGGWDNVRVGADTELVHRLQRLYGEDTIVEVDRGTPLSFALAEPTSLTRAKATSAVTLYQGLRREYREAWAHWHEQALSHDSFRLDPTAEQRPFPAPQLNLPGPRSLKEYDLLFVMDWNLGGGAYVSSLNYVQAARGLGMKVAVWHRRRPDLDLSRPLNPAIRQLAAEGEVVVVSAGESLRARHVLIGYPPIFREPMENPPQVEAETIGVIVNQMADRLYSAKDPQYDPREVRENILRELGQPPMWLPISGHVRELIEADPRYEGRLSDMDWNPLIDLPDSPPAGREWGRGEPVVGRHARDHYTKWPASAAEIEAAYLADKPCRVELLGGAEVPEKILGRLPSNWTIHPFNSMATPEFLARLHFFVHYPNDDYIEEFGRSVIEAISHGVICILPPRFEVTFGPAAVYAEPSAVWNEVEALWGEKEACDRQIHRAAQFVANRCTYSVLGERLANLDCV